MKLKYKEFILDFVVYKDTLSAVSDDLRIIKKHLEHSSETFNDDTIE